MAERPLDCSECQKPISVLYTEIVGDKTTQTVMCADCPHLERKLYGKTKRTKDAGEETTITPEFADLACENCRTTFEGIRRGSSLGCSACYEVFADVIIDDLLKTGKISRHLTSNKKTMPIHIGRGPGEIPEITPTLRLIALNEALDETLIREDYETAAMLRDQIKALKEKSE
ncbi:MAG: UvrB/UvrC motif-containing protein [Chlamydiia bacterium]|nr:UvrB/UvrC motif-containing protein [Chlamydiia bacterium]